MLIRGGMLMQQGYIGYFGKRFWKWFFALTVVFNIFLFFTERRLFEIMLLASTALWIGCILGFAEGKSYGIWRKDHPLDPPDNDPSGNTNIGSKLHDYVS
jgi:hypothetical protein